MRISDWSSDVCSSDLATQVADLLSWRCETTAARAAPDREESLPTRSCRVPYREEAPQPVHAECRIKRKASPPVHSECRLERKAPPPVRAKSRIQKKALTTQSCSIPHT